MPRALSMISRTIKFYAQTARAAGARLDSTARRAPFGPTLYRLPCAVLEESRLNMLPRNPCSNARGDTHQESLATSSGKSSDCDLRQHMRPLVLSGDTEQSKSNASWPSSAQMTTAHPTPARDKQLPGASRRVLARGLPFFDPSGDRVTRDAEGARQAAQRTAFIVSAQDLFALLLCVSVAARSFSTALTTIAAQVTLAAIRSQAITHQPLALAMLTSQSNSDHC